MRLEHIVAIEAEERKQNEYVNYILKIEDFQEAKKTLEEHPACINDVLMYTVINKQVALFASLLKIINNDENVRNEITDDLPTQCTKLANMHKKHKDTYDKLMQMISEINKDTIDMNSLNADDPLTPDSNSELDQSMGYQMLTPTASYDSSNICQPTPLATTFSINSSTSSLDNPVNCRNNSAFVRVINTTSEAQSTTYPEEETTLTGSDVMQDLHTH